MKDKQKSPKQQKTSNTSDQAEASEGPFNLGDLIRITFSISGTVHDCWTSRAVDFQAFITPFSKTSNVDTKIWDVFERLDFLNGLFVFCEENSFPFPFTVNPAGESAEGVEEEGDAAKKAAKKAEGKSIQQEGKNF